MTTTDTQPQMELLQWILESSAGDFVISETGNAPEAILTSGGHRRKASGSDLRDLLALGLIRHVRQHMYEVTSAGRVAFGKLATPPSKSRSVGFKP